MTVDLAVYHKMFAPEIRRSRFAHGWLENQVLVPVRTRRVLWAEAHASGGTPEMFDELASEVAEFQRFCDEMEVAYSPVQLVACLFPRVAEPVRDRMRDALRTQYRQSQLVSRVIPDLREVTCELSDAAHASLAAWQQVQFESVSAVFDSLENAAQRVFDILQRDVPRGIVLP